MKKILITGASRGIGRYLSEYYLQKHFYVIGCSRNESDLKHENYKHHCLDVSDENAVKALSTYILKNYQSIDILINNAGVASMNHILLTPLSSVEKLFKTNFYGTFLFCREFGKIMAKKKYGKIVNFTTVAVPLVLEGEAIYAASKSAVETLTRILSKELGHLGITCNAVGPSPINTDLIKNVPKEKIEKLIKQQAIKEYAEFNDVANVIDFFISEKSNKITGQIIYLSGIN